MEGFEQNKADQYYENNNESQQAGKAPEYSFWAEQSGNYVPTGYVPYQTYQQQAYNMNIKPKKERKALKLTLKALCFGIIAGLAFIGVQALYFRINPSVAEDDSYFLGSLTQDQEDRSEYQLKIASTQAGTITTVPREAVSDMVEDVMPSIVSITSVATAGYNWFGEVYKSEGSGSGIIVGQDDSELLIATNNHVVSGTDSIKVTFIDGEEAKAVIKGADAAADLAVITVDIKDIKKDTLDAIKIAKIGNSDNVKVGQMAIAIGNALGIGPSVTVGCVSAKDRELDVYDGSKYKKMVLLQTDAAINPGNSGGALLNINGEVIGINTVKFADYTIEGMGFAIPISRAIPILEDLKTREVLKDDEKGYLGVYLQNVTESYSKQFKMPVGVYVTEVVEGSAAQKAGLKQGDIIIGVNDREVTTSTELSEIITSLRIGTEVRIKFMRGTSTGYKENTVTVKLGQKPAEFNN